MESDSLPDGWEVWSDEASKIVLAYRPDVFDTASFPAACLPTLYVTKGQRDRRPGKDRPAPDAPWYVTLFLEPDVNRGQESFDDRGAAVDGATALAREFAGGEVDYRSLYQVPRPDYFEKLDELTGRED
jgi:hypothetical protein